MSAPIEVALALAPGPHGSVSLRVTINGTGPFRTLIDRHAMFHMASGPWSMVLEHLRLSAIRIAMDALLQDIAKEATDG